MNDAGSSLSVARGRGLTPLGLARRSLRWWTGAVVGAAIVLAAGHLALAQPSSDGPAGAGAKPSSERPAVTAEPGSTTQKPATPAAPATAPPAPSSEGEAFTPPDHPRFTKDKLAPAKFARMSDGTLRIDNKYTIKGKGTKAEPYVLPFDLLASAENTYKPRLGLSKLPQRVTFFDGTYVKLEGFTAFPIASTDPKEMLVMQNQWDGCCIGTPPTPYDAVEVALLKGVSAQARKAGHGAVVGKFKVDPYDDNGWLLGLYLMEDAEVEAGK